jgi:hypothetical protein
MSIAAGRVAITNAREIVRLMVMSGEVLSRRVGLPNFLRQ